jgi:SHS2 domain-containing protein
MVTPGYELFDHTADLGIRAYAPTLPALIPPITDGLYAAIGDVVARDGPVPRTFELHAHDPAVLLRDYLAELLHLFERERRRLTDVHALEFTADRLAVAGQARLIDDAASDLEREVKAVTYHELAVRPIPGGYEATFIVDI